MCILTRVFEGGDGLGWAKGSCQGLWGGDPISEGRVDIYTWDGRDRRGLARVIIGHITASTTAIEALPRWALAENAGYLAPKVADGSLGRLKGCNQ